MLSPKTPGQLVAGELDPVAQHRRQLPSPHRFQQIGPLGLAVAGAAEKFLLVFRTETTANDSRSLGQAKIVIKEDLFEAPGLDLPQRFAVFLRGGRV